MNERELSQAKVTYMAPMVAPTKRAPKVSPREGIPGEGCEDIVVTRKVLRETLGRQLIDG